MKKHIITKILVAACVALCAAVWTRSAEDGKVPAVSLKHAVNAEIEASPEETLPFFLSDDTFATEPKVAVESKPAETEVNTEEEKNVPTSATPTKTETSAKPSSDPKPGTISVINGERYMWVPGFGWIKDEGGGSVEITVDGEGDINKQVGVMGGDSTVGNPGDELTGNKVGIMDGGSGGTVAEDMYENGNKIGFMGGEEPQDNTSSPPTEQPESTGNEINIVFVETPEKNSTPPPYKPGTTSP